jgi:serine-type D-Ala-D-Ala endopeptidase (penicillin-binding protein 7)
MKHLILAVCAATMLVGNAEAGRKHRTVPVPAFSAKSYLVARQDGTILKEQDVDLVRPIASISKLMLALLVTEQDLTESVTIPTLRQVQSSIPKDVRSLTRKELLTLSLIRSDNFATQVLCANVPDCVERMNAKAVELEMADTRFREPTGLDKGNVSTARDLLKLLVATSTNSVISEISSKPTAEIPTNKKLIKIHNTNPLTSKFNIHLSKTGFTNPAGGCLVMIMNSSVGQRMFVLLGSKNSRSRIPDMERLVAEL